MKKIKVFVSVTFSIALGLFIGLNPINLGAKDITPTIGFGKAECYHQSDGQGPAFNNFCSGNTCVRAEGVGTNFSKCG
ncbi:hypothetical protein [Flavobacteriaceae bacterium 14752]|uniref:hypothetical protein n=1 Tax=Mesohalobacter salilacus TaxID=2491711 RepID=UPI000F63030F|nr:hypothetical protein EIG84_08890 [Flavobacteriaceae bacterium 14752]